MALFYIDDCGPVAPAKVELEGRSGAKRPYDRMMLPRLVFLGALTACSASTATAPAGVTIVSLIQKPHPSLELVRTMPEDAPVSAALDRATVALDAGNTADVLAALIPIVCPGRAPPASRADVEACPPSASPGHSTAWVMIGQLAFEGQANGTRMPGDRSTAAMAEAAYRRAADGPAPSRLAPSLLLYKIGWAQLRQEHYGAAIGTFLDLVEKAPPGDLSNEALQIAAAAIVEPDWDADDKDDGATDLDRPEVGAQLTAHPHRLSDLYVEVAHEALAEKMCPAAHRAMGKLTREFTSDPRINELNRRSAAVCRQAP